MSHQSVFLEVNIIDSNSVIRTMSVPDSFTESNFENYEDRSDGDYILITSNSLENEKVSEFLTSINIYDYICSVRNRSDYQEPPPDNCYVFQFFLKELEYAEELNTEKDSMVLCIYKKYIIICGEPLNNTNILDVLFNSIEEEGLTPPYLPILLEKVILERMEYYLISWLLHIREGDITKESLKYYKNDWINSLTFTDRVKYYLGIIKPGVKIDYDPSYIRISKNPKKNRWVVKQILREILSTSNNMRKYCINTQLYDLNYHSLEKMLSLSDEIDRHLAKLQQRNRALFFRRSFLVSVFVSLVVVVRELYTTFQTNSVSLGNKFIMSSVWLVVGIIVLFLPMIGKE